MVDEQELARVHVNNRLAAMAAGIDDRFFLYIIDRGFIGKAKGHVLTPFVIDRYDGKLVYLAQDIVTLLHVDDYAFFGGMNEPSVAIMNYNHGPDYEETLQERLSFALTGRRDLFILHVIHH